MEGFLCTKPRPSTYLHLLLLTGLQVLSSHVIDDKTEVCEVIELGLELISLTP